MVQFELSDRNVSSFLETKKIFPRDDPFTLKSWLKLIHPFLKAASFDTFCLVAPEPYEIEKEVQGVAPFP